MVDTARTANVVLVEGVLNRIASIAESLGSAETP
jgi:hypothetical protein